MNMDRASTHRRPNRNFCNFPKANLLGQKVRMDLGQERTSDADQYQLDADPDPRGQNDQD